MGMSCATAVPAPASLGRKEGSVMGEDGTSSNQETPPALISGRGSQPPQMPPPDAPVTPDPPNSRPEQHGVDTSAVITRWTGLTARVWLPLLYGEGRGHSCCWSPPRECCTTAVFVARLVSCHHIILIFSARSYYSLFPAPAFPLFSISFYGYQPLCSSAHAYKNTGRASPT